MDVVSVTFLEPADASFTYWPSSFCSNETAVTPSVANGGGLFSSQPATGLSIDESTGSINPSTSSPGSYSITYQLTGPCPASATQTISITARANAAWTARPSICATSSAIALGALVTGDQGGTWTGTGVIGNNFDPSGHVGMIELTYTVGNGACLAQQSHNIEVGMAPTANAGTDATVCGDEVVLSASMNVGNGVWSIPFGLVSYGDLNSPGLEIHSSDFGRYNLYWTVTLGPCTTVDTVAINFIDPDMGLTVDAGQDQELDVVNTTRFEGSATPGANTNWWLLSGSGTILQPSDTNSAVEELAIGENYFVLTVSLGQCASISDTMLIRVNDLFIPQGFSPNGDGVNDRWEVTGIGAFPENTLKVFNRWGQLVFESYGYENEWDGRALFGRDLPDATYFYVLNLTSDRTYNGHVILKR
ncbi:MAG: gliding motility-associated C-terminal domain-containing protein [Flavobacteriales bacterium]|nr:gliding motility-associated C-terminal domain-containing protein [Flavobacteriales bacterium]